MVYSLQTSNEPLLTHALTLSMCDVRKIFHHSNSFVKKIKLVFRP